MNSDSFTWGQTSTTLPRASQGRVGACHLPSGANRQLDLHSPHHTATNSKESLWFWSKRILIGNTGVTVSLSRAPQCFNSSNAVQIRQLPHLGNLKLTPLRNFCKETKPDLSLYVYIYTPIYLYKHASIYTPIHRHNYIDSYSVPFTKAFISSSLCGHSYCECMLLPELSGTVPVELHACWQDTDSLRHPLRYSLLRSSD